jgi:CheY-like chemotaxis protein
VLVNLLSNGIKFTDSGDVVIHVKLLSAPEAERDAKTIWHLHFSVRDTGVGIPVDRLARLFRPFTQADASTARCYGGTGLGLVISKRLVESMGGKMWAESAAGKGSTFHFTLPVQAAPEAARFPLEGTQPHLTGLRLLIVDDNPTNCRILTLQTSKWGMIPRGTQSAQQALEWLRSGEQFDLAILDMQMPGMDGLMLASEIRKLPNATPMPLVLLTSMGVHTDQPNFSPVAFASCLTKPIKPAQLHETLVRVISGSKPALKKTPTSKKLDPALASRLPLRLLLCDDNAVNQKVAARLLQQMGYRADMAANGIEGLAALDRQPYDLIFMDVMMPEMDGFEATRVIRERQQDRARFPNYKSPIIIVAMTAGAMQGDREKCLAAGMDDYLAKPVRPEDIRIVVERWGTMAVMSEQPEISALPTSADEPQAKNTSPAPSNEEPPVDMARLADFTDGSQENLRELVTLYLDQTSRQIEQLEAAVRAGKTQEVRSLAHSCAGASATCGMVKLAPLLRELERQGYEDKLTNALELCEQVKKEFECVRSFLAVHQNTPADLASSI